MLWKVVDRYIDKRREKQAEQYNRNKHEVTFNVGNRVLCKTHKVSNANQPFTANLAPKYEGPFEILKQLSSTVYELNSDDKRRVVKDHVFDLKRYIPPRNNKQNL